MKDIKWMDKPQERDYESASSYLNLLFNDQLVKALVNKLRIAPEKKFKAKDIFRASELSLLGVKDEYVEKKIKEIKNEEEISPILLISTDNKLIIADGYHRLCAIIKFNVDEDIPCHIIYYQK
jgi:uncharacterized protein (DUF1015 family)